MNVDIIENLIEQYANDSQIEAWEIVKKELAVSQKIDKLRYYIDGYKNIITSIPEPAEIKAAKITVCDDIMRYLKQL